LDKLYTMDLSDLINYYIENNYINLDNIITLDELLLLFTTIKDRKYNIDVINIPKDFKYTEIIKAHFNFTCLIVKS